ncbi:helix-turn-helix domain-containing protein [Sediminispirochaeta smaragdinae]|jgi:AraC-like DNA-binding protein/ligand-binding sensor protein|uniref:Transcriptional regulator, AraC family n=1 Tax=Sediminispirochaeta smaragdinae (strain DSM 11293 / JCM 15392 / SEBR 4228) TaxID=573413 RepID=E1R8U3_SEDSS|nr:helix-turn-helix domain-containing protein [Sediminispirochaeta smaragdinae]ADK81850.1 transcriptional regulator, AraC family [Sediminispirochaeta smaragdinae DSM 11293]
MEELPFPRHVMEEMRELLEKAHQAALHYKIATGVRCVVIDTEGNSFEPDPTEIPESCKVCSALEKTGAAGTNCRDLHLYGSYQAERFGGIYIYFCPISLIHWASPILSDGKTVGSMIAGPVTVIGTEEVVDEILRKYPSASNIRPMLTESVATVPQVSTEKAKSLAEVLMMSAGWVSGDDRPLAERRDNLDLQSRISEEIQEQKKRFSSGIEVPGYPIEKERELLAAIRGADKQSSKRILNELLGAIFFSSGGRFEIVKFRTLELLVLLSRAAMEGGADPEQSLSLNLRYIRDIDRLRDIDELSFWLGKVLNRFINLVFTFREVKHLGAIERAVRYIQLHYTEKVTLQETAEAAGLSPAYFSSIFKEEMGVSFSEYVNRLKVSYAKNLLSTTELSLAQVAGQSGFEDQSYFSRIFKRIGGVSPGRYRETGGRLPEDRHTLKDM